MWNYLSQWKCPIYLWESTWIESLLHTVLFISWHKTCPIWLGQIPISCLHKDCHVCSNASWIYLVRQTEIRAGRSSLSEISRGNFVCLAVTWVASKGTWYQNLHVFHSQSLLYLDYFLTCTVYGFWNRIALLTFVTCVKKLILHHEKSPFLHSLFFFLFIAQGNHNEQNEFSYLADFLFCMRRLVSSLKWTFEMLLLSLQYSSLLFDVGFLNPTPQPPSPPPRATSMSTPPSNFYMMIRWHSCLLYTLYTHQQVISHFLGMFHFLSDPPLPPPKDVWKKNPQISFGALWKMKSKGFHFFCCRHWKICPKGPNFVGYFEVEIQTPYSKACHP